MTNFDRFRKLVVARLDNRFHGEKELRVQSIPKNNGIMLTGLAIIKNGETVSPVIYLEDYFERYEEGIGMEMIVNEIYDMFNTFENPDFPVDMLKDFKSLKDKVFYRLINYEKNREVLKTMPYVSYLDLAITFHVMVEQNESGQFMAQIENKHMEFWGTNVKGLYALAEENTPKLFPSNLKTMSDIMKEIVREHMGNQYTRELIEDVISAQKTNPLYVLNNNSGVYGASAILYKNVLKNFADSLKKDLVILPSSIHEVLLMPYEKRMDTKSLKEMVSAINRQEVLESDVLSDNVYVYKRKSNNVTLAS